MRVAPHSRRRAVLTARRQRDGQATLGYHRRKSAELVDLQECPVLQPAIVERLAALRAIAAALPAREARLTVLATSAGLDISAEHGGNRLGAAAVSEIARIAAKQQLARIAVNGETVIERVPPVLAFAGIDAVPPPGAFVQAVEAAELEMTRLVREAVAGSTRVADLFCGVGTFALPMARNARVLAVDSDDKALAALDAAVRRAQGLKPVETKLRDLLRTPLGAKELEGFDAVVFDPPRAGAKAQAERLAQSQVPLVVAVSCDPGTLARDLRILVDGGYSLEGVTPIDQFLFSAHVEAVAVLRRPAPVRRLKSRSYSKYSSTWKARHPTAAWLRTLSKLCRCVLVPQFGETAHQINDRASPLGIRDTQEGPVQRKPFLAAQVEEDLRFGCRVTRVVVVGRVVRHLLKKVLHGNAPAPLQDRKAGLRKCD